MARRVTQADYARLVNQARSAVPDLSITTDIIVAFPGETNAEFAESIDFVEKMEFAGLHIFRYSPRNGTAAAKMPGQVPPELAHRRSQKMHKLGWRMQRAFHRKFLQRALPVLWESSEPNRAGLQWSGLTDNYIRVLTQTQPDANLHNKVSQTRLLKIVPGAILGETACTATQ
jgi:threonylcarbamoyladenosine tRNA methylthiotransferase MtaB